LSRAPYTVFPSVRPAPKKSTLLPIWEGWSPYLSLEDALKLDDVRAALRRGDLESATRLSRVFTLTPVAV